MQGIKVTHHLNTLYKCAINNNSYDIECYYIGTLSQTAKTAVLLIFYARKICTNLDFPTIFIAVSYR